MKIILIAVLIILLIGTIKGIPVNFSKKVFERKQKERMKELESQRENLNAWAIATSVGFIFWIIQMVVYTKIGMEFKEHTDILILSILQIVMCIYGVLRCPEETKKLYLGIGVQYRRFQQILETVLNMVYYPLAIYWLIKSF